MFLSSVKVVVAFLALNCCSLLAKKETDFYRLIEEGKEKSAMIMAKSLVGEFKQDKVGDYSRDLFLRHGIRESYFYGGFNRFDYQRWKYAIFFWKKAQEITVKKGSDDEQLKALLEAVRARVKPVEPSKDEILWPHRIWELKKGICDRQVWVFAEMAYQLRFETMLVYLWDEKTNTSPHTICEIRKGRRVWTVDVLKGKILSAVSIASLSGNTLLKQEIWPNEKKWQKAIQRTTLFLPAYPQDYRPRNQKLGKILLTGEGYGPRFGENPRERFLKYLGLCSIEERRLTYHLWFWPIHLLNRQVHKDGWKKKSK